MSHPPAGPGPLGDVPFLARLAREDVAELARRGRTRRYSRGEAIVRQGEHDTSLHVVVAGSVRVSIASEAGDELTVARLGAGETLGELALLDGRERSATVTAEGGVETFEVTREAFTAWLRERPSAAFELLATLSRRLRQADESLADFLFLDVPQRLAKQLLSLAPPGEPLRMTQGDLAALLGVTREMVNKTLRRFENEGLVSLGRGRVEVRDPEGLREAARG